MIESHDVYVDIQATIVGVEGISIFNSGDVDYDIPYDKNSDVRFSRQNNIIPLLSICNTPGRFSMIFPGEPHRPMEKNSMCDGIVKKLVVKVMYGAYDV